MDERAKVTITVKDVVIRTRIVELPERCPKCQQRLEDCALTGWEYQDQSRSCCVQPDGSVGFDEDAGGQPQGGECWISWVALSCNCGHSFTEAEGKLSEPEGPDEAVSKAARDLEDAHGAVTDAAVFVDESRVLRQIANDGKAAPEVIALHKAIVAWRKAGQVLHDAQVEAGKRLAAAQAAAAAPSDTPYARAERSFGEGREP
jgi:hypothetical protein